MIVVACGPEDGTASAIADDLIGLGLATTMINHLSDLRLDIGRTSTALWGRASVRQSGAAVTALVNRGLWAHPRRGERPGRDRRFVSNESDAAWWALASLFDGPVVNRAGRTGPLGALDVVSLAEELGCQVPPRRLLAGAGVLADLGIPDGTWNAHNLPALDFAGRVGSTPSRLDTDSAYLLTRFEPSMTRTMLLAGRTCYDLGTPDGSPDAASRPVADALVAYAARRGPRLLQCVAQVDPDRPTWTLLAVQGLPNVGRYQQLRSSVHRSLAEVLA